MRNKNIVIAIASFVIGVLLASSCERDVVEVREKIVIKNVKVTDTVRMHDTIVKPVKVYVDRWRNKPNPNPTPNNEEEIVEANKYSQELIGEKGIAKIDVITTGELLDLSGTIECNEKIVEKTITKYTAKSKVFVSGGIDMRLNGGVKNIRAGIDYNIKNKVLLKGGLGYDITDNQPFAGVGIGFGL
tara:strand:- start:82 stop:642 length:561 start_codon:yes stop_codon:yes gene_type:complete